MTGGKYLFQTVSLTQVTAQSRLDGAGAAGNLHNFAITRRLKTIAIQTLGSTTALACLTSFCRKFALPNPNCVNWRPVFRFKPVIITNKLILMAHFKLTVSRLLRPRTGDGN